MIPWAIHVRVLRLATCGVLVAIGPVFVLAALGNPLTASQASQKSSVAPETTVDVSIFDLINKKTRPQKPKHPTPAAGVTPKLLDEIRKALQVVLPQFRVCSLLTTVPTRLGVSFVVSPEGRATILAPDPNKPQEPAMVCTLQILKSMPFPTHQITAGVVVKLPFVLGHSGMNQKNDHTGTGDNREN